MLDSSRLGVLPFYGYGSGSRDEPSQERISHPPTNRDLGERRRMTPIWKFDNVHIVLISVYVHVHVSFSCLGKYVHTLLKQYGKS